MSDAAEFAAIAGGRPFANAAVAFGPRFEFEEQFLDGRRRGAGGAWCILAHVVRCRAAFERCRAAFEHFGKLGIESLLHVVLDHNRVNDLSGVRGRSERHIHMERAAHPVSEIAIERLFVDARLFERRSQIRLTGSGISSAIATMPI